MNLGEIVTYWRHWRPTGVAVSCQGMDTTWHQMDARSDELAAALQGVAGVAHGDVVCILMGNRPEYLVAMAAIHKVGAVVAPLNIRLTAAELVHPIADTHSALVITEAARLSSLEEAARAVDGLRIVSADPDDDVESIDDLCAAAGGLRPVPVKAADGAFVCYTSGTTGLPKGAVLSHGAVREAGLARVLADGVTWRDRMLLPVPLAFTGGCVTAYTQQTLLTGGTCVLERDFDPARCLELIPQERITILGTPPVFLEIMARAPEFSSSDLSTLWSLYTGGSPVTLDLLDVWHDRGVAVSQSYGLTEASGGVTTLSRDEARAHAGSAGRAMLHTQVRLIDDAGQDVDVGEPGEILVRSPGVMTEYLGRPDDTAAALGNGWLHTGDVGRFDVERYLTVVDRKKDMIISGGLNVYPAEVERVLEAMNFVEYAVVPTPDPQWQEVPIVVVPRGTPVDLDRLIALCATNLADYKRPKYIVEHPTALPRSMSGKILRRTLKEQYISLPDGARSLKRRQGPNTTATQRPLNMATGESSERNEWDDPRNP